MDGESWREAHAAAAAYLDDSDLLADLGRAVADQAYARDLRALALAGSAALHAAKRVGLFAGSFNPLTHAHVEVVRRARGVGALDVVAWSEAVVTIDKERVTRATLVDRLVQLRAFAGRAPGGTDAVVVMNRGLYVDQARALRALLATNAELYIIVGFDKLVQILDPRYYDDRDAALRQLVDVARLLVGPRADDGRDAVDALLDEPGNRPYARFVTYFDVPADIANDSATEARALAASEPARSGQLRALVTPEGYALAQTGAYAAGSAAAGEAYGWRQRWEAVLPRLVETAPESRATLPRMGSLVRATLRGSSEAATLRGLVATAAAGGDVADLREALAPLTCSDGGPPRK